ncbi:MAG TPA: hypothetical protein VGR70_04805 [Stellaceae bacterium]|nr:hypothetical protein [Stellaceae bacterium]
MSEKLLDRKIPMKPALIFAAVASLMIIGVIGRWAGVAPPPPAQSVASSAPASAYHPFTQADIDRADRIGDARSDPCERYTDPKEHMRCFLGNADGALRDNKARQDEANDLRDCLLAPGGAAHCR